MRKSTAERFWEKVRRTDRCWEWTAARHHQWQYGHFMLEGRCQQAHRVAWELTFGPIPEGMLVCHGCDNPPCVRPDHLFLGTDADNARDKAEKGRCVSHNVTKTHCPKGHEYSPENTRYRRNRRGWTMRFCIACERQFSRSGYRKNRAARIAKAVGRIQQERARDPEGFNRRRREYMRAYRARQRQADPH